MATKTTRKKQVKRKQQLVSNPYRIMERLSHSTIAPTLQMVTRATNELDRMIDLHKQEASKLDVRIKAYLRGHAIGYYNGQYQGKLGSLASQYVIHFSAAQYLEGMKVELTK